MAVVSLLAGAVTDTGATVAAQIDQPATSCRLAYSLNQAMTAPTYTAAQVSDAAGYLKLPVTGLAAGSRYFYAVEIAGQLDPTVGQFRTYPAPGAPASFTIAHASCAQGGVQGPSWAPSTHRVFDAIRARDPLAFFQLGDLHYKNIATASDAEYQDGIRRSITADRQRQMYQSLAVAYMYDDHDFGPDNSNKTAPGLLNAARVYRQAIPHYPLAGPGAAYQAWSIGRVRFVLTDLRYERSVDTDLDDAAKTMLGATQKAWLKAELLAAHNDPGIALTVWLNTQVWNMDAPFTGLDADQDHWGGFATERAEISNYMAQHGITGVIQLTGDQHALGIKRGADYSTAKTAPMNIYAGSSLDADPLVRGTAWDQASMGRGRYGTLTVTDDGDNMTARWDGWAVDATTGAETLIMSDRFTVTEPLQPVQIRVGGKPYTVTGLRVSGANYDVLGLHRVP